METLNDIPLLSPKEIVERIKRISNVNVRGPRRGKVMNGRHLREFIGISPEMLKYLKSGERGFSNDTQVRFSRMFWLMDRGLIALRGDRLVRIPEREAVRPKPKAYVDLNKMKIAWG